MRKFLYILDRLLDYLGVFAFLGMTVVLCLQIFFRYVLASPLVWATPLAMFLFVWAIWFGGAAGIRDQNQIRVEFMEHYLPWRYRRILLPFINLLCALFLLLVIYKSFTIIHLQSTAVYDTLPFNRDMLFIVVPIVGSVMFLQCLRVLARQLLAFSDPRQGKT